MEAYFEKGKPSFEPDLCEQQQNKLLSHNDR